MTFTRSSLTTTLFKFYLASVLLSSWLVSAQNIPNLPTCAQGCAADALKDSGCAASDAVCQCKDTTSGGLGFVNSIDRCAPFAGCTTEDQSATYGAVHVYCASALESTTSSTASSTGSTSKATSSTPTGTAKPTSTKSQTRNTGAAPTTSSSTTSSTGQVTVTVSIPPTGSSSPTTPVTTFSLPSSAVPTGDSTSVVVETTTSTPTDNAALGLRITMNGLLATMIGVSLIGISVGSFAVL